VQNIQLCFQWHWTLIILILATGIRDQNLDLHGFKKTADVWAGIPFTAVNVAWRFQLNLDHRLAQGILEN